MAELVCYWCINRACDVLKLYQIVTAADEKDDDVSDNMLECFRKIRELEASFK